MMELQKHERKSGVYLSLSMTDRLIDLDSNQNGKSSETAKDLPDFY